MKPTGITRRTESARASGENEAMKRPPPMQSAAVTSDTVASRVRIPSDACPTL